MTELLQAVILGLLIGGVYALMASGLTLVFGVMNIINVAQGAFLIFVAMVTWWLWKHTGIDPILASVITTPMMFGFGWVLYRTVIVRIRGASPSMSVLLTFGLALTIEGILNITAGNKFKSATPSLLRGVVPGRVDRPAEGPGLRLPRRRGRAGRRCTSC